MKNNIVINSTFDFDDTLILFNQVQPKNISVEELLIKYNTNRLNTQPEYQRHSHIWSYRKKSWLIESMIWGYPISMIYWVDDLKFDKIEVVDGQQRTETIIEFITNKFRLEGLKKIPQLNGAKYKDLPKNIQRRFDRYQLSVAHFDSHKDAKEIFARNNGGGENLNAIEQIMARKEGNGKNLVVKLANYKKWLETFPGRTGNPKRMADYVTIIHCLIGLVSNQDLQTKEFGFGSFLLNQGSKAEFGCDKGSNYFNVWMDRLIDYLDSLTESELTVLENRFNDAIDILDLAFGNNALCKVRPNKKEPRSNRVAKVVQFYGINVMSKSNKSLNWWVRNKNIINKEFEELGNYSSETWKTYTSKMEEWGQKLKVIALTNP